LVWPQPTRGAGGDTGPALRAVDRLEFRSVDGHQLGAKQIQFAAEQVELPQHPLERRLVVLAKVGDGFEVRTHAPQQPHDLQIAPGLPFEPPTGPHPIQVSINIQLQQVPRIVRRTPRPSRPRPLKTQGVHLQRVHKHIDDAHRRVRPHILLHTCRQQLRLSPVHSLNVAHPPARRAIFKNDPRKFEFSHSLVSEWTSFDSAAVHSLVLPATRRVDRTIFSTRSRS
jgi:hypothetical protein